MKQDMCTYIRTHVSMLPEGSSTSTKFLFEAANHVMFETVEAVALEEFESLREEFEELVSVSLVKATTVVTALGMTR